MEDISRKKELCFQPMRSSVDREIFFNSLFKATTSLQIKDKKPSKNKKKGGLTLAKVHSLNKFRLVAKHVKGPKVEAPCPITIAFDTDKENFFSTGELIEISNGDYVIEFKKIFKLISRPMRVALPGDVVTAKFHVSKVGKKAVNRDLTVLNISAEGIALEALHESERIFEKGAKLSGELIIGKIVPMPLEAEVKYCLQQRFIDNTANLRLGCRVLNVTTVINNNISLVMNTYYKQSEAKTKTLPA